MDHYIALMAEMERLRISDDFLRIETGDLCGDEVYLFL